MPLQVNTPAGLRNVKDLKVKTADGTLADVRKLAVKMSDGTLKTVWEQSHPLRMFVEEDPNSPNYVSIAMVRTEYPEYDNYWNWINVGVPQTPIPAPLGKELPSHKFYNLHKLGYAGTPGNDKEEQVEKIKAVVAEREVHQNNPYWARLFKFMMDRRWKNLVLPQLDSYEGAMQYMSSLGITDPIRRNEIFMTYHTKIVHVNPSGTIFDTGAIQYMAPLLEGFKGFPAQLLYWVEGSFEGYMIPTQEYHFPKLTNSTGLVYVQQSSDIAETGLLQIEQILFPFRWKNNPNYEANEEGSSPVIRWTDDINHPDVDPFTEEYGLHDLLSDEEKYAAYQVLYLMFHEIGHAIDFYHTMFSAETYLEENTDEFVLVKKTDMKVIAGVGGIPFSCSPAWTRPNGASGWKIVEYSNGKAVWSPFFLVGEKLFLEKYYPLTGPATTCEGYDPPMSLRGAVDPLEDFAVCFACYMLNRNYFSEVFPMKFAAMETYLNSIEDFRREVLSE